MKTFSRVVTLVLATITFATVTFAGQEHGGGDTIPQQTYYAWFLGKTKIQYCIETDKNFGMGESQAKRAFENATEIWAAYIEKHSKTQNSIPHGLPLDRLTTRYAYQTACDGTQDLKLYLGVNNEEVQQGKKLYINPVGFSHRTSHILPVQDLPYGRSQGFIWVAPEGSVKKGFPNWTEPKRLTALFLHELGHTMGCEHIPETIMRKDIGWLVSMDQTVHHVEQFWTSIEQTRTLLPYEKLEKMHGFLTVRELLPGDKTPQETQKNMFERFVGRPPKGAISMDLWQEENNLYVQFNDEMGSKTLKSVIPKQKNHIQYGTEAFSMSFIENGTHTSTAAFGRGYSVHISLQDARGVNHLGVLDRNVDPFSSVTVSFLEPGTQSIPPHRWYLFQKNWWE